MMKLILLYLFNISILVASDDFAQEYESTREKLTPKINNCIAQRENVLRKSLIELNDCKEDLPCWKFIEDQKVAMELLSQFDLSKVIIDEEDEIYWNIIDKKCSVENLKLSASLDKKYLWCGDQIMLEYNYLRALVIAWDEYKWPLPLKEKSKGVALTYLNTFLSRSVTLLPQLMGLQVLKLMSSRSMINKKMLTTIRSASDKAENASSKLSKQAKRILGNKKLSECEKRKEVRSLERAALMIVKKDTEQILNQLSRIP
jgi:hypothetical protein